MKYKLTIPVVILTITLLMACSNEPKSTKEAETVDSTKTKDSLTRAETLKKEENKVLGNITFGVSEAQFDKDLAQFKSTLEHNEFESVFVIGDYIVTDIKGSFDNHKLYKLTTFGDFVPYQRYKEELLPQVEILKDMISKSYGEPHSGTGAPVGNTIDIGYSFLAYSWKIGSKTIEIRVTNRDLYYTADLKIYQPAVEEMIEKREADKETRTLEKANEVL